MSKMSRRYFNLVGVVYLGVCLIYLSFVCVKFMFVMFTVSLVYLFTVFWCCLS